MSKKAAAFINRSMSEGYVRDDNVCAARSGTTL
ncbi:hypothetical protein FOWG_15255 [Fusarium oxysporum f. sp. lycopersici MN25]|uniref:Uncharacterized protein n=1 Tax=Fusarium oxysporum Fo47 TaxID=660027 RepID=W9JPL2_FUSOX|nr:hypothetical protein FOZG_15671 [Fusarium oxysporum Fo47]EWZ80926.1 hypothetical protein FOWG_15255 [Fusarium oxysporum f. sp. lycopersici MN25]